MSEAGYAAAVPPIPGQTENQGEGFMPPRDSAATQVVKVTAQSSLMENYLEVSPVTAGSQLATLLTGSGQVEVFAVSKGLVSWFYPDPTSPSGWGQSTLPFDGDVASVAAVMSGNTRTVFLTSGGVLHWMQEDPSTLRGWKPALDVPTGPYTNIEDIVVLSLGKPVVVACTASTVFFSDRHAVAFEWSSGEFTTSELQIWSPTNGPALIPEGSPFSLVACTQATGGTAVHVANFGDLSPVFDEVVVDFATVTDASGDSHYFVVGNSMGLVYYLDLDAGAWQSVPVQTSSSIAASVTPEGLLELWSLESQTGVLWHTRRTNGVWSEPVEIMHGVEGFAVANPLPNPARAFVVTANGDLFQLWQDPTTTEWLSEQISVQGKEIRSLVTYTTVLTVTDAYGVPYPNMAVEIWASDPILLRVNNETVRVTSARSAQITTNGAGQAVVFTETDSLATATLTVWAAPMPTESTVLVEPNTPIQARLVKSTADELLEARDQGEQYLLQGANRTQEVAESVASAMRQIMGLAGGDGGGERGAAHGTLMRRAAHDHVVRRIDASRMDVGGWSFGGAPGKPPVFRFLTPEELSASRAQARTLPPLSGLLGYEGDLGDLLQEVADGVAEVVGMIVEKVGNTIEATITLICDAVKSVFTSTISFVEQAFVFVELVWTKVEVAWERLVEWLGFFFDWDDIKRTQQALRYTLTTGLDFVSEAADALQTKVDDGISSLQRQITELFDVANAKVGTQSLGTVGSGNSAMVNALGDTGPLNIFATALLNTTGSTSKALVERQVPAAIQSVFDEWRNYTQWLGASDALREAEGYFITAFSNGADSFLENTLHGLLTLARTLSAAALQGARVLVDALITGLVHLIENLQLQLNSDLGLADTFLGRLYEELVGEQFSLIGIASIIVAVPTTLVWKIVAKEALFTPESLDMLKKTFTTSALLSAVGLNGQRAAGIQGFDSSMLAPILAVMHAGATFISGLIASILDSCDAVKNTCDGVSLPAVSWIAVGVGWFQWVAEASSLFDPNINQNDSALELTVTQWTLGAVGCFVDTILAINVEKVSGNYAGGGQIWCVCSGALNLALGVGAAILDDDAIKIVQGVFAPIPAIGKIGLLPPVIEGTEKASVAVTSWLDLFSSTSATSAELIWALRYKPASL